MIEGMAVLHITESELARDVHGVIEKVRGGAEVVIEHDNKPVAVIKAPPVKGRNISEVIAAMEASGANATVDEDFARDVEGALRPGRSIDECIALAKDYEARLGHAPVPDPDFAKDVQAAIDAHREPLDTSLWDGSSIPAS
jgi:antitoxin (DNA-binding transcriptional repressor) of toxin-antitoxin stability system